MKELKYILISLLVAIILHLLFKSFYTNSLNKTNEINKLKELNKLKEYFDSMKKTSLPLEHEDQVSLDYLTKLPESKESKESRDTKRLDSVIEEYAKNNRLNISGEKKYTPEEIDLYRENFIDFRTLVEHSSREMTDPVDRMNLSLLNNKNELEGIKISEIYGNLTRDEKSDCVLKFDFDPMTMSQNYKSNGNDSLYFQNTQFAYCTDGVENGGTFYDEITGYDMINTHNALI